MSNIADLVTLYCDNIATVALAKEPQSQQRTKHIRQKYHLLRDFAQRGEVAISKITPEDNVADPLTKAIHQQKHDIHVRASGIRDVSSWL